MIYNVADNLNEAKTDLIGSIAKHLDAGFEKIEKAIESDQAKFNRAVFDVLSEEQQNGVLRNLTEKETMNQTKAGKLCGVSQGTVSNRLNK